MKRRKFLIGVPLLAGGVFIASAIKWVDWNKDPNMDFLLQSRPLLASIADTILPKTDSPAASECGVPEFIIQLLTTCTDIRSQNKFINGLKELESYSMATFKKSFSSCTADERIAMLNYFDEKDKTMEGRAGRVEAYFTGRPFSVTLREYCITAYFTSEEGATQALRYVQVPGAYIPCEPYVQGEKAWTTR